MRIKDQFPLLDKELIFQTWQLFNDMDTCLKLLMKAFPKKYKKSKDSNFEKMLKQKGGQRRNGDNDKYDLKNKNKSGFWTRAILDEFQKRDKTKIDQHHQNAYDSMRGQTQQIFNARKEILQQARKAQKAGNL